MSRERKLLRQALAALEDESLYEELAEDLASDIRSYFDEHPFPGANPSAFIRSQEVDSSGLTLQDRCRGDKY